MTDTAAKRLEGVFIGTAVGDALGLPAENLSSGRIKRLWKGELRMRFFFGKGMLSDDTEHTAMVAQALFAESKNPEAFQKLLARKPWWWFAALPAGVGLATARRHQALARPPSEQSCGAINRKRPCNAKRYYRRVFCGKCSPPKRVRLASSKLTHRSWQAEIAALAVAECAAYGVTHKKRSDVLMGRSLE